MSTAGAPVSSTPTYNSSGNLSGGSMNIGGKDGTNISMVNPGMQNPYTLNPYAAGYLSDISGMRGGLNGSVLSPAEYQRLQETQQDNLTTSLGNKFASMGLAGSSAEMGGLSSAIEKNQMDWLNRQQSDYAKYLNEGEGLDKMGYGMTTGIQGQFGDFQDAYNQDILGLLGLSEQQKASNQQMLGQMFGGLGSFAGTMGGMGMKGGSASGTNGGSNPTAPNADPYAGQPGGTPGGMPYAGSGGSTDVSGYGTSVNGAEPDSGYGSYT